MILFGNKISTDVNRVMIDHTGLGWALNSTAVSSYETENDTQRQRRQPCKDGGRDWSDMFANQGIRNTVGKHHELSEEHGIASP